jgi:hypothetical protein
MDLIEPQEEDVIIAPISQRVETTTPQSTIEFEEILNYHAHSRAGPPIISLDNIVNSPPA